MLVRALKLKLNRDEEVRLKRWLWHLTAVWNFAVRKIELDAHDGVYHSAFEFQNLLAGHSVKVGIPSHVLQGVLTQVHQSWKRCFAKISRRPRLKGRRNPLNSIPFPDPVKRPITNKIRLLGLGHLRYHKQDLPEGKIKCARIVKRPSGWHLCLWIDAVHKFPVKTTAQTVGIDPGFHTLLTLSDGRKIENPRELRKGAQKLGQAQRGRNKRLVARLQERQANRRRDRNHKISRRLIEEYQTIFYSEDNFRGLAKVHGKSVREAGLGQLIGMLTYKAVPAVRRVVPVSSRFTTMTCSACGALSGPKGWGGLAVRQWQCSACGADHDRDINAAKVVARVGAGSALNGAGDSANRQKGAKVAHDQARNFILDRLLAQIAAERRRAGRCA
jgi:putative transposase